MAVIEVHAPESFWVDSYLCGILVVRRNYRGLGIERELLMFRDKVCAEHNLIMSSSLITKYYENNVAKEAGFIHSIGSRYIYGEGICFILVT